ncbi:1-(5-phosphoribosyl)-5-[(5-phosphoribosylamino)methylideneamino] imidazole-4-carboxamide isomerase [Pseudoalteromonas tunicata]|uniref:1-(5-phosphoribosyl)-5-[(5- phosphoribosylamino)methylideneamino] imidazole-4-carboxamide isomerase n=1 Tax=Pseudoalteromonas tunicata TaxID=314281 RepID=UPI00273F5814|nr:1-(5-phosphoribosyl)-5-[(5-phosphoribosylamino)methylideneamino] imidazole-4-carboxamide isomerase [Pseudoalteromonas tunicata]MDP4984758.1 1-(5-phosphoribosyl)-5-[(5-phosphoribosylamino)methylideneamino] imidazole-4-carboxamide isomerase [Pseudoalteromonas tunicata]MDP5214196.1 1-(5-phosphoribosyl)-5-[(5-phosphoribosylamino)methylideneamino] imidazole-4-carboxamide isomerase [Pseudoalteromonas tunicata]
MIIPALDVLQNRIVRLYQGKYDTAQFYPYELGARLAEYAGSGASKLHLVDLEGARDPSKKQWQHIQKALEGLKVPFQIGGGIRSESDISTWLAAGAKQVVIGSMAVEKSETVKAWISQFGPEKFVIALDVNKTENGWLPATHGWLNNAELGLFELVAFYKSLGVNEFLCTDISKDGTMTGPSFPLYQDLLTQFPDIQVQASGGVSSLDDIAKLKMLGVSGIILGKSLLDGAFSVEEAITCCPNA